jgi:hypothetical protein
MRVEYASYGGLYRKHKHIIVPLANSLKSQAEVFFNSTVSGHAISDIAHPPNEILIDEVVLNTVSDLVRIKGFHSVTDPNRYKYAAYIGFWWQRGKPFSCKIYNYSVPSRIGNNSSKYRFIDLGKSLNEIFITGFMLSMIQMQDTKVVCAELDNTFPHTDLKDSLCYFLKYRHYSAQALELFLKGFATCPVPQK